MKRITMNAPDATAREIETIRNLSGETATAAVSRAVKVLAFLEQAQAQGASFLLVNKNGERERIRFL